jgi:hypothetical protein
MIDMVQCCVKVNENEMKLNIQSIGEEWGRICICIDNEESMKIEIMIRARLDQTALSELEKILD